MAAGISRMVCALVILTAIGTATWARAADEPAADAPAGRLETKHIDDGGRVKIEIGPTPRSSVKLVPFPEDLEEEAAAEPERAAKPKRVEPRKIESRAAEPLQAESRQTKRVAPKSDFQPRFKEPAVRRAQHVEPAADDGAAEKSPAPQRWKSPGAADESSLRVAPEPVAAEPASEPTEPAAREPAAAAQGSSPGKPLIEEAFAKSKTASADSDYSDIIELCGRASQAGLRPKLEEYSRRLMSWSYNRRGEAHAAEGREPEALADFEAACRYNDRSWRALHNRGVSHAAAGKMAEAMADFNHTIELNQSYPNAYFNRGELWYAQGKYPEAIRDYTAAINLGSPDALMFNSRGHAFYRMKRFGDALREYGEALKVEPNNAAALINRGDTYLDLGRYADAAQDYRSAVRANPQLGRAYQAAAWLMASCPDEHYRNEKLAMDAASKAIELDGEDYRNLETLAAAQANAGQFAEAKATQEKAIAKVPRGELVVAEKRMALYQREVAYREPSRQEMIAAKSEQEPAAAEKEKKTYPVQRASANEPEEQQLQDPEPPAEKPQRTTRLPQTGQRQTGPPQRAKTRPRMLPKMPTHPLGRN